eukprot:gene3653-3914_t
MHSHSQQQKFTSAADLKAEHPEVAPKAATVPPDLVLLPARPGPPAGNVSVRGVVKRVVYAAEDGSFKVVRMKVKTGPGRQTCNQLGVCGVLAEVKAVALAAQAGTPRRKKHSGTAAAADATYISSLLCVTGALPGVREGHELQLSGSWVKHEQYGYQVKLIEFRELPPSDPAEHLVSCIKGVGTATAERIVDHFGADNVRKVLSSPDATQLLSQVKGIGKTRAEQFKKDWDENTGLHESFTWLHGLGCSPSMAQAVSQRLRFSTKQIVVGNPYSLIGLIASFRFHDAEKLAAATGFNPAAPQRAAAALRHELLAAASNSSVTELQWDELQQRALATMRQCSLMPWPEGDDDPLSDEGDDQIAAFEAELSEQLKTEVVLNKGQQAAVKLAMKLPVLVLTGGPGCGKTLTSQVVARAWLSQGRELAMAAPTGRAAQRLQEVVSSSAHAAPASTIHRLLGYRRLEVSGASTSRAAEAASSSLDSSNRLGVSPAAAADVAIAAAAPFAGAGQWEDLSLSRHCSHSGVNYLPAERLLVDEVSMMDVPLAAALFDAIDRDRTTVLLVGDADQLPPVGPGRPLAAALSAKLLPCLDLRHIYRSAAGSAIVQAAHAINQGKMPQFTTWQLWPSRIAQDLAARLQSGTTAGGGLDLPSNALMLELPVTATMHQVQLAALEVVKQMVPLLRVSPTSDVQVLSPTRRGVLGVAALNQHLQPLLNPEAPSKLEMHSLQHHSAADGSPPAVWREGDRVVHLVNDPDRDVYNGDLGLLRRHLLYTAVSRAKLLLVVVGTQQAVQQCIHTTAPATQWQQPKQQQHEPGVDVEEAAVWSSSEGGWLTERLRAAAAAKGLQPFPCMVFGDDGWQQA